MSFASQKNDMLLRNMIYSLNANMIDSSSTNMICLPCGKRSGYFYQCACHFSAAPTLSSRPTEGSGEISRPVRIRERQRNIAAWKQQYFLPPTSYLRTEPDLPFRLCSQRFCSNLIPMQIKNVPSTIPANATGHFPCLLKP